MENRRNDPQGEIGREANRLFEEAGRPAGKTADDFYSSAEERVLGKRGDVKHNKLPHAHASSQMTPEFQKLADQHENPYLSILASGLRAPLNDHESTCLALVLGSHQLFLHDGRTLGKIMVPAASELLSELAGEYVDESLASWLKESRDSNVEERIRYWEERLDAMYLRDEPVSYAQQNTIRRLVHSLASEPRVKEIRYLPE